MSTINEQIVTGRANRVLIDKATKLWQRISVWTKGSDVEFNDGQTAETKVGAIKGITTDLNTTETGYAADMTALAQLYSDIQNGISIRYDAESDYIQCLVNNIWKNWIYAGILWDGIYYNYGDQCVDFTGGWILSGSGAAPGYRFDNSRIVLCSGYSQNGATYASAKTKKGVKIPKQFKKIILNYTAENYATNISGSVYLQLCSEDGQVIKSNGVNLSSGNSTINIQFSGDDDVHNMAAFVKINVNFTQGFSFYLYINKVWLE